MLFVVVAVVAFGFNFVSDLCMGIETGTRWVAIEVYFVLNS